MPIPSSVSDLSQTAADNYPTGGEVIGNSLDNYLRAHASFIRQPNALASASIASASTVDVSASDGEAVLITGTTTITSLGAGFNGCKRELRFDGVLTLTHSDNLKLPNDTDITTAAGDIYTFRCTASGVWRYVSGSTGGSGSSSSSGSIPQVTMAADRTFALTDSGKHIYRTAGNATIPLNSDVAFPIGSAVTIVNAGASAMTLFRASGANLYQANNASAATSLSINARGLCTVLKTGTNEWMASGPGVA